MSIASSRITALLERTREKREQVQHHPLYSRIVTLSDIHLFMQTHVFAVWDFMSLLKALQRGLTCIDVPWVPTSHASARLINEIVRDEESDESPTGESISHLELYRTAMLECGADTSVFDGFLKLVSAGSSVKDALTKAPVPEGPTRFVQSTFTVISTNALHRIAGAFTFGREDLIPEMFSAIVREMKQDIPGLHTFHYYLERHIELDGDDHGPRAERMIEELCGSSEKRWQEATEAANQALEDRIRLWDSVVTSLKQAARNEQQRYASNGVAVGTNA